MVTKNDLKIPALAWLAMAAFLVAAPMLFLGNAWGYDFDFHTSMWMDAARQFQLGILLPRWSSAVNAGFGEPSFLFYPPLPWMIGGLVGLIIPWKFVAAAVVFLAILLAGGAAWKLARIWLEPRDALIASLIYAWSPYLLVNVYKRCDYAELYADALSPLLVWAAIRLSRDGPKMIPPLIAIFAAIWLSDLPEAMVASYSLALLLAMGSLLQRSWRPALLGSVAIVGAFACLTFFLMPAMVERPWVKIAVVLLPEWMPENNFVFTPNVNPMMVLYSRGLSFIAVLLVVTGAVAAAFTGKLRRHAPQIWYSLAALAAAAGILLFRVSWILWQILPAMRYVEFPSRWLTPLAVADAVLVASAIADHGRKRLVQIAAVAGAGALGAAMLFTVHWDRGNQHIDQLAAEARAGTGFRFTEGKDWRLPANSHPSQVSDPAPLVTPADGAQDVRINVRQWTPERKVFSVDSPHPALLKVKLFYYPAWQAKLNGQDAPLQTDPVTGQILLPTAAGSTNAEIAFTRTWDRTVGMLISLASLLIIVLASLYYRRRVT